MRKAQLEAIIFRRMERQSEYKNSAIEFLVLKRIPKKGGFWQPVTGGWESEDASMREGLLREVREETDVTQEDILRIVDHVHYFELDNHPTRGFGLKTKEYVFGIEVRPDTAITITLNVCPEHEEVRWVRFDEALHLLKWQNNKNGFTKLNEILLHEH